MCTGVMQAFRSPVSPEANFEKKTRFNGKTWKYACLNLFSRAVLDTFSMSGWVLHSLRGNDQRVGTSATRCWYTNIWPVSRTIACQPHLCVLGAGHAQLSHESVHLRPNVGFGILGHGKACLEEKGIAHLREGREHSCK